MSMAAGEVVRYCTRHGSGRISRLVLVAPAATPFPTRRSDNPAGIPKEAFESFRTTQLLRDFPRWLEENRPPFFTPATSREMQDWVRNMSTSHGSDSAAIAFVMNGWGSTFRATSRSSRTSRAR